MRGIYGLDVGIMMFEAIQLAAKDPDIVMNQEYICGVFNMDFVAFNFPIEESISFKKKLFLLLEMEGASIRTLDSAACSPCSSSTVSSGTVGLNGFALPHLPSLPGRYLW